MIVLFTDFGLYGPYTGQVKAVLHQMAPGVPAIDLFADAPVANPKASAYLLAAYAAWFPAGTIFLCVVDPGVGSERRAVAIRTATGRMYVGPDNGLLTIAADADGIEGVRSLTNPHYHLDDVSRTFHARDLFSPVAAHLAAGASFGDLGDEVDPVTLVRIDLPAASIADGELRATVLEIDRFGNLGLNVSTAEIDDLGVDPGDTVELSFALTPYFAVVGRTYVDAARGELILYEDSYGAWSIAINGGNAAALTEAGVGDEVRVRPA